MPQSLSYSSLVPPNLFILAALTGVVLAWRWRRIGLMLATAAVVCIYFAATPLIAEWLIDSATALTAVMPVAEGPEPPGAIVVLSADLRHAARPGVPDTAGRLTLERLAEAARLQRRLGLPILVSGGWVEGADAPLAEIMSRTLREDFGLRATWLESRSRTTYENALFSAELLRHAGIPNALLVTNPWHMARALWAFAAVGYPVTPADISAARPSPWRAASLLPQIPSLYDSYLALHELIGLGWYRWRYHPAPEHRT
jgi:uncharacterized SAM-binding protein YcdF (DUF218 family)